MSEDLRVDRPFDLLAELPCSQVIERPKAGLIYESGILPPGLYLVMDGYVTTWRQKEDQTRRTILDFHGIDDVFGESCILPDELGAGEGAGAVTRARLMFWPVAQLLTLMYGKSELARALLMMALKRSHMYATRIEELALWTMHERLGRLLVQLGERFGQVDAERGVTAIPALTHETLAEYCGTSREIVTNKLNAFRRQGLVQYSRRGIAFKPAEIRNWMYSKMSEHRKAA